MTQEEKAKAYDELKVKASRIYHKENDVLIMHTIEDLFPELKESEDERIRKNLIGYIKGISKNEVCEETKDSWIAWLEKQGSEPNWCHHKVDLSNCSEEYRKAYYDGWNNCNMQHSQCESESNDVVKCLINGMKFYYEDNKEATWGTEKFSMKVKDILAWLEKQGEPKSYWKPSKDEMDALYGLAYITNKMDDKKDEAVTKLYQDLKREFFNGTSYENMFPSSPVNSDINIEKQGELIRDTDTVDSNEDGLIAETIRYKNEKQCEQEPADKVEPIEWSGKINSRNAKGVLKEMLDKKLKSNDKVEPKFKVGDKIQYLKDCGTIMTIEKIENGEYIFANNLGHTTIEDGNKWYLVECNTTWSKDDEYYYGVIQYIINNECVGKTDKENAIKWFKSLKERVLTQPRQKWSEEDDIILSRIIADYERSNEEWFNAQNSLPHGKKITWLKSLKDRVQLKPKQEWNEEDEDILNTIINHFEIDLECTENDDIIRWLKSLRPQNKWKPSDEQMKVLKELIEDNNQRYFYTLLRSLYDQLKILKGE